MIFGVIFVSLNPVTFRHIIFIKFISLFLFSQLNFDDDALSYKDKRYILDSSGNSRGVSIFIQNGSLFYKVRFRGNLKR